MADATTTLLLDAINQSSERSESACNRIERRMDEGFSSVHGRINGVAEAFAALKGEHDRLAPLHRAPRATPVGDSVVPGPKGFAPSGRDWSGFGRVLGWIVAAAAALIGIAAQVVR